MTKTFDKQATAKELIPEWSTGFIVLLSKLCYSIVVNHSV